MEKSSNRDTGWGKVGKVKGWAKWGREGGGGKGSTGYEGCVVGMEPVGI